jgi:hypothetical protein
MFLRSEVLGLYVVGELAANNLIAVYTHFANPLVRPAA